MYALQYPKFSLLKLNVEEFYAKTRIFLGVGGRRMSIVGAKKKSVGGIVGVVKKPPTDVEIKMWAL